MIKISKKSSKSKVIYAAHKSYTEQDKKELAHKKRLRK